MTQHVQSLIGNITVEGLRFIPSDTIASIIREAFEKYNTPKEIAAYITKRGGQCPRNVFVDKKQVIFERF